MAEYQNLFFHCIMYCESLTVKITTEAMKELKSSYIRLRMKDDGMAIASARTTVRQLESLIRLSEAYARLKCDSEVQIVSSFFKSKTFQF